MFRDLPRWPLVDGMPAIAGVLVSYVATKGSLLSNACSEQDSAVL